MERDEGVIVTLPIGMDMNTALSFVDMTKTTAVLFQDGTCYDENNFREDNE